MFSLAISDSQDDRGTAVTVSVDVCVQLKCDWSSDSECNLAVLLPV